MPEGNQFIKHLPGQLHGDIRTSAITTVSGGPTLLESSAGPLAGRKDFLLYNGSAETVFVGGSDVTIDNGIPVLAGGSWAAQLGRAVPYATVSGSSVSGVKVMEIA